MDIRFPFAPAFAIAEELLALLLIGAIVFLVVMALRPGRGGRRARHTVDEERARETEALGRMLEQLDRMERRMQNLETIILDKDTAKQDREERS